MTSLTSVTVSVPLTIRRRGGRNQIIGPDGAVARPFPVEWRQQAREWVAQARRRRD